MQAQELDSATTCQQVRLAVSLQEGQPASYQVTGQLCHKRNRNNIVHLLVSGATYGHVYWDFPVHPEFYSYVRSLTSAGYATFNFDRIGIVYLSEHDIVRHPLVQKIVAAYEDDKPRRKKSEA